MSTKALLINSTAGTKENPQGAWHLFDQSKPYIQGIETGGLTENLDAEILNTMVSGLPNLWARAYMFKYAFKYTNKDANIKTSGLIKYYESLIEEWKGLAALMAVFPDRITISKPLYLESVTDNIYDIAASFGDMLFDDKDLWADPKKLSKREDERPFIQIIYYNGAAVGATSPHTLFFTAVENSGFPESHDVKWFRNGRLCDPLIYGDLNRDSLQKIYLLINNLIEKIPDFEKNINSNRGKKEPLSLAAVYTFLKNSWAKEILEKGGELVKEGVLDSELDFSEPFKPLFSIRQDLFYKNGRFSFSEDFGGEIVDLQKLLLQDEFLYSFEHEEDDNTSAENAPVYYLKALDPSDAAHSWYFPLPLSCYGLNIFKNKIGELVNPSSADCHELRAIIKGGKVSVELYLQVDGRRLTPVVKEYRIKSFSGAAKNVIMWPDFVSKDWTAYYLYNEFPSNNADIKFVPFYKKFSQNGGFDSGEFITDEKNNLVYADNQSDEVSAQLLVRYPVEIASADSTPYEILRSDQPFAGLEIRSRENGKDRIGGYLIVKKYNDECKIKDLSYETGFENVIVGIDFGSNNSCLSYSPENRQSGVSPIKFLNRRVFLCGNENYDLRHERTALRNELLFFQNEPTANGQIKSWVHDHDRKYVPEGMREEEISGGVPVFEPNIIIHSMDERTIKTNAGILHHNMKWLSDAEGKAKKKAFLKSIWTAAVADLFAERKIPTELRWSYPGAFSRFDVLQYQQMYNELSKIPLKDRSVEVSSKPSTEAEAVCNYALTSTTPDSNNIMLGIDVGGSTSDVLLLAMNRAERCFKLEKQSSLRLAAGMFVNVISQSEDFRRAVYKFHESPACKFKVANIKNIIDKPQTSPFYLNAVLDRLENEEFNAFYSTISQSCPQVFAVPAYITGLLMFYSGKLARKTIEENGFNTVKIIDLLPFGKGGRLFDWLDVYPGKEMAAKYYNDCFKTGYSEGGELFTVIKKDSIRKDNKSEVSMGLSAAQKVKMADDIRDTSDLIGEEGFLYFPQGTNEGKRLSQFDTAKSEYLSEMDFGIEIPQKFQEFEKFLQIFTDFTGVNNTGILSNSLSIQKHKDDLIRELKNYITNDSQWQKADIQRRTLNSDTFDYRHSLLVLEGMCFLEKFIIPEIK